MFQDFDRFERLGFQCNPFRALTNEEWQAVAVLSPTVLEHLQAGTHIQLLGAMGRGKSTTLMGIWAYYAAQQQTIGYEYLAHGQHHFQTNPLPPMFLLDEVQRLWWWEKHRLFRTLKASSTRLIYSSHINLLGWFQRYQLAVISLSVEYVAAPSLADILARRLAYFRTRPTPIEFTPDGLAFLEATFGTNRRAIERFLYEVFQTLSEAQPLDANYLRHTL